MVPQISRGFANLISPPTTSSSSSSLGFYTCTMNLWQKWMSLPVKARYYIAGSTFVFALVGDYVTSRINEEVVARKKLEETLSKDL